jgi:hypothetical protein
MISYRCPDCGAEDDHFHHRASDAPESIQCRGVKLTNPEPQRIEHKITNPDGTVTVEYELVEPAPIMSVCAGTMLQRTAYLGELYARPARGFEPLVIYQSASDPTKFSFPGRNNEPTDAGYKRIEITSMHEYNKIAKQINNIEIAKMKDHRSMHEFYWNQRRKALRDHVNARIRHSPMLVSLARLIRARSDRKTEVRYGKALDAHFHSQLLEFNQGNIQDWCAEDSGGRHGWKSQRAK